MPVLLDEMKLHFDFEYFCMNLLLVLADFSSSGNSTVRQSKPKKYLESKYNYITIIMYMKCTGSLSCINHYTSYINMLS